ncbi:hypothetical protein CVV38_00675 [Candidatus Peregrinibacteria bacterium HGW-Peregrinibacteria-1]|jgi:hypothetical protein|nr:MAG: hypothetical protein CVV38_00675 [Candidatus Peregrinibacteria bacterium HGW-Peregrinibacteria-1]
MKTKLILALSFSAIALSACGGASSSDAPMITFNCPVDYTCTVNDPETGNTDFYSLSGFGGMTMGPLVTADAMRDAETMEEAKIKIVDQFQVPQAEISLEGSAANGRPYIVFPSQNNPGQTTYVELHQNGDYFFGCTLSGVVSAPSEIQEAGEAACSNMNS